MNNTVEVWTRWVKIDGVVCMEWKLAGDKELFDFVDVLPEGAEVPKVDSDHSDSNFNF